MKEHPNISFSKSEWFENFNFASEKVQGVLNFMNFHKFQPISHLFCEFVFKSNLFLILFGNYVFVFRPVVAQGHKV